jgi:hypothetical protein
MPEALYNAMIVPNGFYFNACQKRTLPRLFYPIAPIVFIVAVILFLYPIIPIIFIIVTLSPLRLSSVLIHVILFRDQPSGTSRVARPF